MYNDILILFKKLETSLNKTSTRLKNLNKTSTCLKNRINARLVVLSANATSLEHRLNKRLDTVSTRLSQMTDNMVTNILATALPQSIAKVNAYITKITKDAINRKINVAIKNGFNHRITRQMDNGIPDSIAEDGRINCYVEECIRANNNGSIAAATTKLQQFKTPTNDQLTSLENTYQTLTANLKSTNNRLDELDTEVAALTYPSLKNAIKTPTTTVNPAMDDPDIVTPCTDNQPLTSQRWTNVKLSPIKPPAQPTAQPQTLTIPPATELTEP
jgi:hypothetical protein